MSKTAAAGSVTLVIFLAVAGGCIDRGPANTVLMPLYVTRTATSMATPVVTVTAPAPQATLPAVTVEVTKVVYSSIPPATVTVPSATVEIRQTVTENVQPITQTIIPPQSTVVVTKTGPLVFDVGTGDYDYFISVIHTKTLNFTVKANGANVSYQAIDSAGKPVFVGSSQAGAQTGGSIPIGLSDTYIFRFSSASKSVPCVVIFYWWFL